MSKNREYYHQPSHWEKSAILAHARAALPGAVRTGMYILNGESQSPQSVISDVKYSSTRALLNGNSVVFAPGPKPSDLNTIHSRTIKLEKQMFEKYNIEIKIKKKFNEDDLRMNLHELDVTIKYFKMKRLVEGLSKQINKLKLQCSRAERLSQWEAWVRPCIPERLRFQEEPPTLSAFAPRADDPYVMARDAAMAAQEDDDDDGAAAKDP
ncbi:hypothetical protein Tco_0971463 [Tanacetum coccineum]